MICEYGCNQTAIYKLKNGRYCCSKSQNSCPKLRIINSKKNKGVSRHTIESKKKISEAQKGHIPWNKNKLNVYSNETKIKMSLAHKGKKFSEMHKKNISISNSNITKETRKKMKISHLLTIKIIQKKYLIFAKMEEMRYKPGKEDEKVIQVHCKNHNCPNSKEQGGWFTPTKSQLYERIRQIEGPKGNNGSYFYCSIKCKQECPLYKKTVNQLIKLDLIAAGHIEEPWYNSQEYQTWRNKVFELDNGLCVYCGEKATIAHHILPQKTHPELSLDPKNGLSVCKECHYKYGHRDSWCSTGYLSQLVCKRISKFNKILKK